MSAADELQRLEREIDAAERQRPRPPGEADQLKPAEKPAQPERHRWVRRMEPQSATALQNGLTGAPAGMLAWYAVGRLRR